MASQVKALRWAGALALAVALVAAGCGDDDDGDDGATAVNDAGEEVDDTAPSSEPATATGTLTAADQSGDGSEVTVADVSIDGAPGWVAVHSDVDGAPGPVLGTAAIDEGSSTDVVITLDEPLAATTPLWPMLHVDDNAVGEYEFPAVEGADLPVTEDGAPVMMQITVTVG